MNNYVYEIKYSNNKKYIGVRSCECDIEDDIAYMGSSKITPECGEKTILKIFKTREDAVSYEIELHSRYNVHLSDEYYNQVKQTSLKFDQSGCTKDSHPHILAMSEKLSGRKMCDHNYMIVAQDKRNLYVGKNRTDLQKIGSISQAKKISGVKNSLKGHNGTDNSAFVPWYYISPDGSYHEVHNVTKEDYADSLGFTPRQLSHRFHYTNIHKEGRTRPFLKWVFGNLPRP